MSSLTCVTWCLLFILVVAIVCSLLFVMVCCFKFVDCVVLPVAYWSLCVVCCTCLLFVVTCCSLHVSVLAMRCVMRIVFVIRWLFVVCRLSFKVFVV